MENSNDFTTNLLMDSLNDIRNERKSLKRLCIFLCSLCVLLILGIIGINLYSQNQVKDISEKSTNKFMDFINNMEFESSIEMSNENSINHGDISVK